MRKTKLARSGGLLLAAILVTANLTGSASAAETGSVTGTFTDRAGAPMAGVNVKLMSWESGAAVATTSTDDAGKYSFLPVNTGSYGVIFEPSSYPYQYAYQSRTVANAAHITVSNGVLSTVDDQLMAFGIFTGRLTKQDGSGLGNQRLSLFPAASGPPFVVVTTTDANGYYTVRVEPGVYRFQFTLGNGQPAEYIVQHIPGTDRYTQASNYTIAGGETLTVNDVVMPMGYLTGTFTTEAGVPMANVAIEVKHEEAADESGPIAVTDASGQWRRRVRAGSGYVVFFDQGSKNVAQWAVGKPSLLEATRYTVLNGQTLTVNDSRVGGGSLRIRAHDAITGEPVMNFQATIHPVRGVPDNTPGDGEQFITDLPAGTYEVSVTPNTVLYQSGSQLVTLLGGAQTSVDVALPPTIRIDAKVVDAQTGDPIAGVCLFAGSLEKFRIISSSCEASNADGRVKATLAWLGPGSYQLLALPVSVAGPIRYGAQWVGSSGGKGSQLEAATITVAAGEVGQAPLIKMDRAGTITGRVTNQGIAPDWVSLVDTQGRTFGAPIGADGTYSVDFLGPYAWPLRFEASTLWQYSGGTGGRHDAERIQVTAGGTTAYNYTFVPEVEVQVHVPAIPNAHDCTVMAFDARSGEQLFGRVNFTCSGPLRLYVTGKQGIKLQFYYWDEADGFHLTWHGGTDLSSALAVRVDGPLEVFFDTDRPVPRIDNPPSTPTPVPVPRPTVIVSGPPVPRL